MQSQTESLSHQLLLSKFPSQMPERDKFLFVIDAYLDESGTHAGSPYAVVAGFMATAAMWDKFVPEWQEALDSQNLEYFRMSRFENYRPPFTDWSKELHEQFLQILLDIITTNLGASLGMAIPMDLYDSILSDQAKAFCGGPYGLAAQLLFIGAAKGVQKINPNAWINYTLEDGAEGKGQILHSYENVKKDPIRTESFRLLGISFQDKRKFLPLQAADFIAYEIFKHAPKQPTTEANTRYPMRYLGRHIHNEWVVADKASFENMNVVAAMAEQRS